MSESIVPLALPESLGGEPRPSSTAPDWMQVVKASDAEPLVLPKVETERARSSREKRAAAKASPAPASEGSAEKGDGLPQGQDPSPEDGAGPSAGGAQTGAREEGPPGSICDQVTEEAKALEEKVTLALDALAQATRHHQHALEGDLITLSLEIAEALAEGMVEVDPDLHLELARAALAHLDVPPRRSEDSSGEATELPGDLVRLRSSEKVHGALQALLPPDGKVGGVAVELVLDSALEGLGCVVESSAGRVDGTLDTRLGELRKALRKAWNEFGAGNP